MTDGDRVMELQKLLTEAGFALRYWMPTTERVQVPEEVLYKNDCDLLKRIDAALTDAPCVVQRDRPTPEALRDWLAEQFEDWEDRERGNGECESAATLRQVVDFIRATEIAPECASPPSDKE